MTGHVLTELCKCMRNDSVNWEADKDGDPRPCNLTNTSPRACFCGLPASLHPARLGRTSAQTTPGLGTGFGGRSSKGLPFSNTLWDRKHRPICEVVLFQTDIFNGWPSCVTEIFSYQNLNTRHHCFLGASGRRGGKKLLC